MQDASAVKNVQSPNKVNKFEMFKKEYFWRMLIRICGLLAICITISIAAFLFYSGAQTFLVHGHSPLEFLFSTNYDPSSSMGAEAGSVGAGSFIMGSLMTCGLALCISTPLSLAAAIFMAEISPRLGSKLLQPATEIFVGIPSIVYGWTGLTLLVPLVRDTFNLEVGNTVFTAAIVLALMIFPSITSVATDAIRSVPKEYRDAGYGLGSTRWQNTYKIVIPAALPGILTGVILGLARAFGEALAVSMVIGKANIWPSLFGPTSTLTTRIASDMGNAFEGTEEKDALWTMALLLFLISLVFIFVIHFIAARGEKKMYGKN